VRNPTVWGTGALAMVAIVAIVAGLLYVNPLGHQTVSFRTDDAASITPGMTVRIAGITVGKVKDLAIEPDQVRVRATVDKTAFVGDRSNVQVRMLTVVGGYYVNIDSLGDVPLGGEVIPKERVTMPYNLMRAVTDTTKITETINPAPIERSLDQVQQGLAGENLGVITSVVDAGAKLTDMLDRQRGQVSAILDMSDEYIRELSKYRDQFTRLVSKIAILEQTLVLYGKGFSTALLGMGEIMKGLGPVGDFYRKHRDKFLAKFIHWQQIVRTWANRSGFVVRILRRTRDRMEQTLAIQNAPPELLATDLCIPLPGSPC
jgi:virulence factor Mce-like protein